MKNKEPAKYEIVVEGHLDDELSDRIAGMAIAAECLDSGKWVSRLTGQLSDQAELSGVLNTLYDLRMDIISVETIG